MDRRHFVTHAGIAGAAAALDAPVQARVPVASLPHVRWRIASSYDTDGVVHLPVDNTGAYETEQSPAFKKIYADRVKFRDEQVLWQRFGELPLDNLVSSLAQTQ